MKNNVGNVDKFIRIMMGIGLLSLVLIVQSNIRFIGLIGVVPLLTAFIGFCPIHKLLGLNSRTVQKKQVRCVL